MGDIDVKPGELSRALLLAVLLAGCSSARPTTTSQPRIGSIVRVRSATPVVGQAVTTSGDTLLFVDLRLLEGRLRFLRADTAFIELMNAPVKYTTSGVLGIPAGPGPLAIIALEGDVAVEAAAKSGNEAVMLLALLAFAAGVLALYLALGPNEY